MKIIITLIAVIAVSGVHSFCKPKPPPPKPDGCRHVWNDVEEVFKEKKHAFEVVVADKPSGCGDDDISEARCRRGYELIGCKCKSECKGKDSCDGAVIVDQHPRDVCRAYNMYGGKGVRAVAFCMRIVITCSSHMTSQPAVKCPKYYKLVSCSMYSPYRHKLFKDTDPKVCSHPTEKRKDGTCYTTAGCDKCRVQAVCIRKKKFRNCNLPKDASS